MPTAVPEHLRLLSDETRLRILHLLAQEPLSVAELQELLEAGQSSVSGHLGKLRRAGFIHVTSQGSSHRYRIREDLDPSAAATWRAVSELTIEDPTVLSDRRRLADLRADRSGDWVERVAGALHREYAPGRTLDTLFHGLNCCLDLGDCVDIGAGDGAMVDVLAPRCRGLICVDPSPAMVAAGRDRIVEHGFEHVVYHQATGEALDLPTASADHAFFIQSLQYIGDPAAAIGEARRLLRPGGRIVIMTLLAHRHPEAERYGHVHRGFTQQRLARWLADWAEVAVTPLPPEARAPRFQSVIATARKV